MSRTEISKHNRTEVNKSIKINILDLPMYLRDFVEFSFIFSLIFLSTCEYKRVERRSFLVHLKHQPAKIKFYSVIPNSPANKALVLILKSLN